MDKNTFLAVVLSGAIMVIWYAVFPPPEPPPREFTDSIEQKDKPQLNEIKKKYQKLSNQYQENKDGNSIPLN